MLQFTYFEYFFLVVAGVVASIIDTIVGSGGIVVVPALLAMGVSPLVALGTNKLQEPAGQLVATLRFIRTGELHWKIIFSVGVCSLMGASCGAILVQLIHNDILDKIIPLFLMLVLIYSVFSDKLFTEHDNKKLNLFSFSLVFGLFIGFYNGFFGPGTGLLFTAALISFFAMDLRLATMYAKPANLCCNVISLIWFVKNGNVHYFAALALMFGGVLGSIIGAHLVIKKGAPLIKPIFIAILFLLTMHLFWEVI
ncbi:MAG TPA: TSUP family transporter [Gammaproteobacteria bacterium]|nr:TSUP family transporter [Gammaproteobacteria bacterium]